MKPISPYPELNRRWKAACKVILGGEVGELREFGEWLSEGREPILTHPSSLSSKKVTYGITDYSEASKWLSHDEADYNKKFEPLGINDIKDMDAVLSAVQERIYYTGNVVLGNSVAVERSSNIVDSFYVMDSKFISDSKHVAYSSLVKYSDSSFGSNFDVQSNFVIRGLDSHQAQRCLEILDTYMCADSYYCFGVKDSSDCMFSFNLRGKHHVIGNLQLPKDKYVRLKKKLVEDMRAELESKKRLPALVDIVRQGKRNFTEYHKTFEEITTQTETPAERTDLEPIKKAFSKATDVILGRPLSPLDKYDGWLMRHVRRVDSIPSLISGRDNMRADLIPFNMLPRDRIVTVLESLKAAEAMHLSESEVDGLSLENASKYLGKIALFTTEIRLRENRNLIEVAMAYNARDCYNGGAFAETKYSAFSFWPRESEYMFGCNTISSSSFCINSYYSKNLSRCLEVDSSNNCSASYFLHNCENVRDSMFCFNAKNKRHAIGNAELEKGKYAEASKKLIAELADELERKGTLPFDIYALRPRHE